VDSELKALKATGIISDELYQEYASALSDWGNIGYSIMEQIMSGQTEEAADAIINQCTPALDNAVAIGKKLDAVTDKASHQAVIFDSGRNSGDHLKCDICNSFCEENK